MVGEIVYATATLDMFDVLKMVDLRRRRAGDGACRCHPATINIFPLDALPCNIELCINK
jgi:hypothetical protein